MRNVLDSDNANGGFLLGRRSWNFSARPRFIRLILQQALSSTACAASCFAFLVFWPFSKSSSPHVIYCTLVHVASANPTQSYPIKSSPAFGSGTTHRPCRTASLPAAGVTARPTRRIRQRRGPQLRRGRRRGPPPGGPGGGRHPQTAKGQASTCSAWRPVQYYCYYWLRS